MKKNIILLVAIFLMNGKAFSQELRSSYFMQTSVFKHQMNPALLDKSYFGIPFLGNINVGTTGNNGLASFLYPLNDGSKYSLTTFMNPTVSSRDFLQQLDNQVFINAHLNYNIFSFAFKGFGGRNVIEANLHSNNSLGVPRDLFVFLKETDAKQVYSFDKFGFNLENYAEIAMGHSHKITENITIGAKVKALLGISHTNLKINKLHLIMNENQWAVEGDTKLSMALFDSKFEYDENPDPNQYDASRGKKITGFTSPKAFSLPGAGIAVDLGVNYNVDFVKGLSVSASLTDFGFINWKNIQTATSKGNWIYKEAEDFSVYDDNTGTKLEDHFKAMGDELVKVFSMYDEGVQNQRQFLSATLYLGAEYTLPFYEKLRAGLLFSRRFADIHSYTQTMFSLDVRPVKWFEISANTAYTSSGWTAGGMVSFYAKGFNLYIGSDRFVGKLSKQFIPLNNLNTNINLGLTIPLS